MCGLPVLFRSLDYNTGNSMLGIISSSSPSLRRSLSSFLRREGKVHQGRTCEAHDVHRALLKVVTACCFDDAHRIIKVHFTQNEASAFQQIAEPLQFGSLRSYRILIHWIVSDDVLYSQ